MIISIILAGLFLITVFPFSEVSIVGIDLVIMFLALAGISLFGLIKNSFIPAIMLIKAGIFCIGIGVFILLAGMKHLSVLYILLCAVFVLIGAVCIFAGATINSKKKAGLSKEKSEKVLEKKGFTYKLAEKPVKVKKIWQYKLHGKPELSKKQQTKKTMLLVLSSIGIAIGFMLPVILLFTFRVDNVYSSGIGYFCYFLSVASLILLGMTLGEHKAHHMNNIAFVLCEDGSVFFVDYFDVKTARELGYFEALPWIRKYGISTLFFYGLEADKSFSYIRSHNLDKKIAENCDKYGYQIVAVPEIVKCAYYTDMKFYLLKDENEGAIKTPFMYYNLYDNCYDGYDEMVEYFEANFDHKFDEAYEKTTKAWKGFFVTGIVTAAIGIILGIIGAIVRSDLPVAIAYLAFPLGCAFAAASFDRLNRRKKSGGASDAKE